MFWNRKEKVKSIDAHKAYKQTEKERKNLWKEKRNLIFKKINEAIECGNMSCAFYWESESNFIVNNIAYDEACEILEKLGYRVAMGNKILDDNGAVIRYRFTVSWGHAEYTNIHEEDL